MAQRKGFDSLLAGRLQHKLTGLHKGKSKGKGRQFV